MPDRISGTDTTAATGAPLDAGEIAPVAAPERGAYTRFCAALSKLSLMLAVIGLIGVVLGVQYQVVGRYIFNDTPTWAEGLSLLLVLYVTAFGLAVGVRDAGHIGLESMVALLPPKWQHRIELLIHALVGLFGALMVHSGWQWSVVKWEETKPLLGVPDSVDYFPLVIAGVLIVLFSIEHIIALVRGTEVVPAWN